LTLNDPGGKYSCNVSHPAAGVAEGKEMRKTERKSYNVPLQREI